MLAKGEGEVKNKKGLPPRCAIVLGKKAWIGRGAIPAPFPGPPTD